MDFIIVPIIEFTARAIFALGAPFFIVWVVLEVSEALLPSQAGGAIRTLKKWNKGVFMWALKLPFTLASSLFGGGKKK